MLKVYNTLAKKKEAFKTASRGKVKMYCCGITPYDESHLGHARCYITWDMVKRYLSYSGFAVEHVQNFTDVDDKIIERARQKGMPPAELAEKFTRQYFEEFDALNVLRAGAYPKATENIKQVIELIALLEKRGFAYENGGDVFFQVSKFAGYGKLSGQGIEQLISGKRVEANPLKRSPEDFALWKASKPGEPSWDSPWGKGRPGWHIECSAMGMKYLGETFDLHCGGQDLIFPHHENEIAQSEAATGKHPFAKYWLHNGFITVNKEKMAKSLGNFTTLRAAMEKYSPNAIRYFMLSTHYRAPIDFSPTALAQATESVGKLESAIERLGKAAAEPVAKRGQNAQDTKPGAELEKITAAFAKAMDDDFNTPAAFASLFELRGYAFAKLEQAQAGDENARGQANLAARKLEELFGVLGFKINANPKAGIEGIDEAEILEKIRQREEARKAGDYSKADAIRKELAEKGIVLEDAKGGAKTGWRYAK
ncbi:MAG: cysteine--tRNA ligase [Candidatus Micrarchaeota archaeon]